MSSKSRKSIEHKFNAKEFGSFADLEKNSHSEMLKLLKKGPNVSSTRFVGGRFKSV
jgi:hypothetical protein